MVAPPRRHAATPPKERVKRKWQQWKRERRKNGGDIYAPLTVKKGFSFSHGFWL